MKKKAVTKSKNELAEWVARWAGASMWTYPDGILSDYALAWRAQEELLEQYDCVYVACEVARIMRVLECTRIEATFRALRAAKGGGVMERGRMYVHDDGSIRDATGDEFDEVEIVEAHNGLREVCTTLRARVAELEAEVMSLHEAIDSHDCGTADNLAELEAWKADSLLRWQQAVTLGGQQLERIAELEREKGELAARIEAMEPFVAMGAAHTPGAYGPACRDCGAPMIGVERCQHCGGKH